MGKNVGTCINHRSCRGKSESAEGNMNKTPKKLERKALAVSNNL